MGPVLTRLRHSIRIVATVLPVCATLAQGSMYTSSAVVPLPLCGGSDVSDALDLSYAPERSKLTRRNSGRSACTCHTTF